MDKKAEFSSLREQFADSLKNMILSGEIEAGKRLPVERELSEKFGVSRQVINSGVSELERKGFLKVMPRHGTYVTDYRKEGNIETLISIMEYSGEDLSDSVIRSILEVRWAIEHLTLRNTIEKADDHDLSILGETVERIRTAGSEDEAAEAAFSFQHNMAIIGKNEVLPLFMISFRTPVIMLWKRYIKRYGKETLYKDTLKSYRYILNRDFEGARKWLDEFMNEAIAGKHQVYKEMPEIKEKI